MHSKFIKRWQAKSKKHSLLKQVFGTALVASCSIFPVKAFAETFRLNGDAALNTNNKFRKIDGYPRASLFKYREDDKDQHFIRLPHNQGGNLLKHGSTGNCLNAHYLTNGSEVNVFPCNSNDPDQNFILTLDPQGFTQIKRGGTNKCLDAPTRDNESKVYLWDCQVGNPNQQWISSATNVSNPPKDNITEEKIPLSLYEVWIIARKPERNIIPTPTDTSLKNWDVGHAWIAIVKRDYTRVKTFQNGNQIKKVDVFDRGGWQVDTTYGFWRSKEALETNNKSDVENTEKYLRGESISSRGYAVRKMNISANRADWAKRYSREAGCETYKVVGGIDKECNCADYATRQWHFLTSNREDFRIKAFPSYDLLLDGLVDNINKKNRETGDFVDGGKVWQ